MPEVETKNIGLRGVTVADTRISLVDGEKGLLNYRGYAIETLAQQSTFEEVVFLLLMGRLPSRSELEATTGALRDLRALPASVEAYLRARPRTARPMDVVQGGITALADDDPALGSTNREDLVRSSLRLIARTATMASRWLQLRGGRDGGETAAAEDSHAGAFLRGLWGRTPTPDEVRLMDALLVLHAEHSLNASTFAAREVASTRAHLYSSVSAAFGALSGDLHGGANASVMRMLLEIEDESRVEDWVAARIKAGQRVMGLGHAVYVTTDPRAAILRDLAAEVLDGREEERWFRLALKVQEVARRRLREEKALDLYPNVDFYSSPVLYAMGIPIDMFPVFFGVSRTAGWCAHVIEETFAEAQPKPALYRPDASYVGRYCGPAGCEFVPIEARGGCPTGAEFKGCDDRTTRES
ncbi:MAG: citrate/2-methylcitrate synthase [Deltaproteobacteria bacterium]|nr:citrate/2-methylcitrate synthase [Deltaproteobacteria bacterium]